MKVTLAVGQVDIFLGKMTQMTLLDLIFYWKPSVNWGLSQQTHSKLPDVYCPLIHPHLRHCCDVEGTGQLWASFLKHCIPFFWGGVLGEREGWKQGLSLAWNLVE